jgi:hypothetical protein
VKPRRDKLAARIQSAAPPGWAARWDSGLLNAIFESEASFGRDGWRRHPSAFERNVERLLELRENKPTPRRVVTI